MKGMLENTELDFFGINKPLSFIKEKSEENNKIWAQKLVYVFKFRINYKSKI